MSGRRSVCLSCLIMLIVIVPAWGKSLAASSPIESAPPSQDVFAVETLNEGGPQDTEPLNLRTPQETLRRFFDAARQGQFAKASRTLNLAPIPLVDRLWYAPYLAERFYYVLNKQSWINRSITPDREDGQLDGGINLKPPDHS